MAKYRKKPVEVEAIQWNGENAIELIHEYPLGEFGFQARFDGNGLDLVIATLEGDMKANIGDYLIKDIDGKFYPCTPNIFEKTYEIVE